MHYKCGTFYDSPVLFKFVPWTSARWHGATETPVFIEWVSGLYEQRLHTRNHTCTHTNTHTLTHTHTHTHTYIYIKLHGLSPRANYTDRATAGCRRSDCQLLRSCTFRTRIKTDKTKTIRHWIFKTGFVYLNFISGAISKNILKRFMIIL
jgi:hypothetical protein